MSQTFTQPPKKTESFYTAPALKEEVQAEEPIQCNDFDFRKNKIEKSKPKINVPKTLIEGMEVAKFILAFVILWNFLPSIVHELILQSSITEQKPVKEMIRLGDSMIKDIHAPKLVPETEKDIPQTIKKDSTK